MQGPPSPSRGPRGCRTHSHEPPASSHHRHLAENGLENKGPSRDVPFLYAVTGRPRHPAPEPPASRPRRGLSAGETPAPATGLASFLPSCHSDSTQLGAKITQKPARTTPASRPRGSSFLRLRKGPPSPPLPSPPAPASPLRGRGAAARGQDGHVGPSGAHTPVQPRTQVVLNVRFPSTLGHYLCGPSPPGTGNSVPLPLAAARGDVGTAAPTTHGPLEVDDGATAQREA